MEGQSTILILKTKLQIPNLPSDYIFRPHLIEYLNKDIYRPLTLISAGAGYGKSTFVSSWFKTIQHSKAWVSLDPNDNDIREFISYFIYAIREKVTDFGRDTIPLISGLYLPDISIISKSLINELNRLEELFILALDDLYFIKSMEIYRFITTLLKHPPLNFHLVLITRIDPPIPLSKLRSKNMMKEIRVSQLKFTETDIRKFINTNIKIPDKDANTITQILTSKVDGWITGLRLALLQLSQVDFSKQPHEDILSKLDFTEHYIIDEIINQIDSEVLDFLIKTSVLKRINSAQVSYVFDIGGIDKTDRMIMNLVHHNLFIINLDNEDNWYRYHHLLHSFLQKEFKKRYSKEYLKKIHIRAAKWYEKEGMIEDAFYHTTQLDDPKFTVALIERNMYVPLNVNKWYVLNEWLKMIPKESILKSPDLIIAHLWVSQHKNKIWEIPVLLEQLKSFKKIDEQLESQIAFFEGFLLFWNTRIDESIVSFKKALNNLPKDKVGALSLSKIYYATALSMKGKGEEAYKEIERELYDNELDNSYKIILDSSLLFIKLLEGKLDLAEQITLKLRKQSEKIYDHLIHSWTSYELGYMTLQRNELDKAETWFVKAIQNINLLNTTAPVDCYAGLLITQKALGKTEEYKQSYKEMTDWIDQRNSPILTAISYSLRARLSLSDHNTEQALKYMSQCNIDFDTGNTLFWIEHPRITECRVLLSENTEESIRKATEKLLIHYQFAKSTNNKVLELKSLIHLSIAYHKQNKTNKAKEYLHGVLSFAIPNSFRWLIIDSGDELLPLLSEIDSSYKYNGQVLEMIKDIKESNNLPDLQEGKSEVSVPNNLIHLSKRESEITGYLAKRYTNKEIADLLFISEATVKRHTINIYQKLGVNKRRDAVKKAQELGLLS